MEALFNFLGIALIIGAIIFLVISIKKRRSIKKVAIVFIALISVSIVMFIASSAILNARDGFAYRVINPDGKKYAILEPGWKFVNPWANIQEWNKYIDIRTIMYDEESGEPLEDIEGVEGIIPNTIPIRFTDQVTGKVELSIRAQIPEDEESFLNIAEIFRHPKNLTNNTLIPAIREQVINTTYMFTAEGYVNGEAGEYRQTIDDALKNGGFKMKKVEVPDTIYNTLLEDNVEGRRRTIKEIKTRYKTEKVLGADGLPIRYEHDINKYNITIAQAIIDRLELEPKFKQKLEQQRDIAAEKSIEADKIEKARISQQRIIAEGERDKAAERVAKEKQQVGTLIAIETRVKEEESKRQLAEIALKTSKLSSAKRKVDADAKRYELQQADGLSEEMKFKIEQEVKERIGVAQAIAGPNGITLPTNYTTLGGGSNGKSQDLTNLLLLKMLEKK